MQLQRTICDQKFGSELHFGIKQSALLPPNTPFCTQNFQNFLGVIPRTPIVGGGNPLPNPPQRAGRVPTVRESQGILSESGKVSENRDRQEKVREF